MSESGAILPKRLTGVKPRKQRKLTRAIKRSHVLALLPKTWKLPRYRHASYADQYATHEPTAAPSQLRTACASLLTPDPLLLKFGRFSLPEKAPPVRSDDDDFRDPPDIRFPNVWESSRSPLEVDLSRLVRASPGLAPRPKAKGGA